MHTFPCLSLLLATGLVVMLSGCVSSRYKAAPKRTPPAAELALATPTLSGRVLLHSVIIYRGPGSWKRNAYWDEYVLTIENHGADPIELTQATLFDFAEAPARAGVDPWQLEKESQTSQARFARTLGTSFKIGAGAVAAVLPSAGLAMASVLGGAASAGASTLTGALLPVYLVGTVYRNVSNRRDIEAEFARRRMDLPLVLAPGGRRAGSLFFPVTPGPKRLELTIRHNDSTEVVVVELGPLANLHLTRPPGTNP